MNGIYRFFKFQQTGPGFKNTYGFGIRHLGFFGILFETDYVPHCRKVSHKKDSIIISNIIFYNFALIVC